MRLAPNRTQGPALLGALMEHAEQKGRDRARDKARRVRARPRRREPRTQAEARLLVAAVLDELPRPDAPVQVPPLPTGSPLSEQEWARSYVHREQVERARRIQQAHDAGQRAIHKAGTRERTTEGKRRRRAARQGRPVQRGGRLTWTPAEVVSPQYVNQVDLDGQRLERIARTPEARKLLREKRASHQRLRGLSLPALAILETLAAFQHGLPAEEANGHASLGVQWGVEAGWVPLLGYSRSAVFKAFSEAESAGYLVRYSQSCTASHLTRHRAPADQVDTWVDAAGNEHDDVQTYTVTYLTHAGAELLEGLGHDVGGKSSEPGRRGWVVSGFSAYVRRLLSPLARVVLRRVGAATTPLDSGKAARSSSGSAASEKWTPLTPHQEYPREMGAERLRRGPGEGEGRAPTGAASPDRPCPTPPPAVFAESVRVVVAPVGRSALGDAVPLSKAAPPPLPAMDARLATWHGLSAEGYSDGLTWEGGGLAAFAEVVTECWTRARRPRSPAPGAGAARRREARPERQRDGGALSGACLGCGAPAPTWQGDGAVRVHGPRCPIRSGKVPPGVDLVWAPAMSAGDWYRVAWEHRPDERPELERLFAPVARELERRRAEHLRGPFPPLPLQPRPPAPPTAAETYTTNRAALGRLLHRLAPPALLKR